MSPRLSRRALLAFAAVAIASLVAAPAALSPIAAVTDVQAARNPEGRILNAPVETLGERAVSFAMKNVGVRYRWGGESPTSGFDCSGLVRWSYGRVGIEVPHNSYALYGVGRRVSRAYLKPGDVLFFEGLGHVGLYLGRGRMVHAPYSGKNVEVVRLAATNYGRRRLIGARRVTAS